MRPTLAPPHRRPVAVGAPPLSASAPLDRPGEWPGTPRRPTRTALSFELIPPRHGADAARLDALIAGLASYHPDYVSVTSSRRSDWLSGTAELITRLARTTELRPIAHLACTAGTRAELTEWIRTLFHDTYKLLLELF